MVHSIFMGTLNNKEYKVLRPLVEACFDNGCYSFDTAPSYKTESVLGQVINELLAERKIGREKIFISDKIDSWQMIDSRGKIIPYAKDGIDKLKLGYVDLLLMHWPISEVMYDTWENMLKLKEYGLCKYVGLSNVRISHLKKIKSQFGCFPDFIQIERHPMRTCEDIMAFCNEFQIKVQAYTPLCRMNPYIFDNCYVQAIADKYYKNIGQIVLRWHIQTGSIPIFTSTKKSRVSSNLNVFDFCLDDEEIKTISELNCNYKFFLESYESPGYEIN